MHAEESYLPLTYLKNNTTGILETISNSHTPVIITHKGEPKFVLQDLDSYYELKRSISMIKRVLVGKKQIDQGKTKPANQVFDTIERKLSI